jgi:hypothetical protein
MFTLSQTATSSGIKTTGDLPFFIDSSNVGIGTTTPSEKLVVDGNLKVTGTTNGVKVYRALLTQSGTNAPVATVLENTLGSNVTFVYDDLGTYIAQNSLFTNGKTAYYGNFGTGGLGLSLQSEGSIAISAGDDNQLINASIEILVYP